MSDIGAAVRDVHHIGIAVSSLEKAIEQYMALGFHIQTRKESRDGTMNLAIMDAGNAKVELLEPKEEDSPVGRFLRKRGEGIHHIALSVKRIEEYIEKRKELGVAFVSEQPRVGAEGERICFIHPKSAARTLIEICEVSC
ncbi:MAG: methylmalonyl-CoA epimerase [bacterium]